MKKIYFFVFSVFLFYVSIQAQGFKQNQIVIGSTIGQSYDFGGKVNLDYSLSDHFSIGFDILKTKFDHLDYPISYDLNRYSFNFAFHGFSNADYDLYIKMVIGINDFKYTADTKELLDIAEKNYPQGLNIGAQIGFKYYLFSQPYEIYKPPVALNLELGWPIILGFGLDFVFDL
jgi:hypothetical protein